MTDYNGWTNYETWAVKLWMDNDEGSQSYWLERAQAAEEEAPRNEFSRDRRQEMRMHLAEQLKDWHEEAADELIQSEASVFTDLMSHALGCVNWHEIADSLIEDAEEVPA